MGRAAVVAVAVVAVVAAGGCSPRQVRGRAAAGRGEEGGEEVGEGMGRLWGEGDRGRLAEGTLPACTLRLDAACCRLAGEGGKEETFSAVVGA